MRAISTLILTFGLGTALWLALAVALGRAKARRRTA